TAEQVELRSFVPYRAVTETAAEYHSKVQKLRSIHLKIGRTEREKLFIYVVIVSAAEPQRFRGRDIHTGRRIAGLDRVRVNGDLVFGRFTRRADARGKCACF